MTKFWSRWCSANRCMSALMMRINCLHWIQRPVRQSGRFSQKAPSGFHLLRQNRESTWSVMMVFYTAWIPEQVNWSGSSGGHQGHKRPWATNESFQPGQREGGLFSMMTRSTLRQVSGLLWARLSTHWMQRPEMSTG